MFRSINWIILIAALISGCSWLQDRTVVIPVTLEESQKIDFPNDIRKCCFDTISKTLYIMPENDNTIHIYRDGKEINIIGRLGFDKSNFNRLEDITLAPDGKLLALDSFSRKIKKFDKDGGWIANYDLNFLKEPTRFDVNDNEEFYIYDNFSKDVTIIRNSQEEEHFAFGKFQLTKPQRVTCNRDYVWVYDEAEDATVIYNAMGQHIEDAPGFIQLDRFNQQFRKDAYAIEQTSTGQKLAIGLTGIKRFFIESGYFIVVSNRQIILYESRYDRQPNP